MSLESDIAVLRKVALFEPLETDQLRLLAFGAERRRLRAGEYVFRQDARSDAGFIIVAGTVTLFRGRAPNERFLGSYGPDTLLGEIALITETRRPASARTDIDSELLRIGRPLFRRMLEEYPAFAVGLHEKLSAGLIEMTKGIVGLEERFSD